MKRIHQLSAALLIACTIFAAPSMAHDYQQGDLHIEHPWSRPTPPGTPMGVGYLVITNSSGEDITLTAAQSPRAGRVSIHETSMHEGLMRMQPLKDGLTIPAGKTVELKPQSYHLMLEQLTQPLVEGESIPLRLDFDGAEAMDVELKVEPLDGAKPMDHSTMDHSTMDHSNMKH